MRIGLFTDTYFPQVSGVATSIRTLKQELEKLGHTVFIFTTTDRGVDQYEDWQIVRIPSVPFFAFRDRRVAYRGFSKAYEIARQYNLDLIHTHTEFALGMFGKTIARELGLPVVHTYHTQYEDYVHYFAKGMLIRPSMVKYIMRGFMEDMDGVICPSQIVSELLEKYKVKSPLRVIPTGIDLNKFDRPELTQDYVEELRQRFGIEADETMLLSLSRISYEKNIQAVVSALPEVLLENPRVKLVIAGDGPYKADLEHLVAKLDLTDHVQFTGMISPNEVALYYKAADFFISASTSETQGLTFLESLASGTPIIAQTNPYLASVIDNPIFGKLYEQSEDLAGAILEASLARKAMDSDLLTAKLYEISAENFGKTVAAYYEELIAQKAEQLANSEEVSTFSRIGHRIAKIPSQTKRLSKSGYQKIVRASKAELDALLNLIEDEVENWENEEREKAEFFEPREQEKD